MRHKYCLKNQLKCLNLADCINKFTNNNLPVSYLDDNFYFTTTCYSIHC